MPKDSTTWLSTRPPAGPVPVARMVSAGIMVIARRARQGDAEADESGHDDLAGWQPGKPGRRPGSLASYSTFLARMAYKTLLSRHFRQTG